MTSEPTSKQIPLRLPFPAAWFYAVIKMDPVAMVKDLGLDDTEALAALATFHPKKYLVYVDTALDLPMPNSKWCRYCITVIGSTLCPEDRKNQILPDMVVPIFPNMQCSSSTRQPIRPLCDFPFSNCFHWIECITYIRMRRHGASFVDDSHAIRLDSDQDHAASWTFMQDYERMKEIPDTSSLATCESDEEELTAVPSWALLDPVVREACSPADTSQMRQRAIAKDSTKGPPEPSIPSATLPSDLPSAGTSSQSSEDSHSKDFEKPHSGADQEKADLLVSTAEIFRLNIFGWDPDPTFPLFPLVDLWFDLEEHLTEDTIPSPVEWFKEEKKINSIIRDAFARRERMMQHSLDRSGSSMDETARAVDDSILPESTERSDSQADLEQQVSVLVKPCDSSPEAPQEMPQEMAPSPKFQFKFTDMMQAFGTRIRRVVHRTALALCFRPLDGRNPESNS